MFFYPNRPTLVPPDPNNPENPKAYYVRGLEKTGRYVAEKKWNGENTTIETGSKISFWNRYGKPLKYYPDTETLDELSKLPKGLQLNVELMHHKTKEIKHILIAHCCMVYKGQPLIGKIWGESRKIVEDLPFGKHLILSELYHDRFWELFQEADGKTVEGIILKDPTGRLVISTSPIPDVSWMLKIRKPRSGVYLY